MTDYNKQTVAQLRQLLKDRSIPSTGLQRKAQIIERLQEADQAAEKAASESDDAPVEAPESESQLDAPPDPVEQMQQESGGTIVDSEGKEPDQASSNPKETVPDQNIPTPSIPTATLDANREAVSHIDSDAPPPDRLKTIAGTAEDTTLDEEPAGPQPAGVFRPPPTDAEDIVGPKVTEPTDAEMVSGSTEAPTENELPDAPGPAAEALRYAREGQKPDQRPSNGTNDDTPSPAVGEKDSVEKVELLTIPERSTAETSRLNTEELEADTKKRKRRSNSPDLPVQDIRAKKSRPSQDPAPEVYLKEDLDVVMEQQKPDEDVPNEPEFRREKKEKADRYKDLIKPGVKDVAEDPSQDDQPVAPALHPATPALYIRNFMRPLRPEPLLAHLISLASPPSGSPDASIVKSLFLDALKTHALVLFTSMTAASRVRASLHGSIWPPEGNRKELWVDFIPEDRVEEWIKEEEDAITAEKEGRASGRPIPAKRFEVVYDENADGSVTAVFQEAGSNLLTSAPRGRRASIDARRPSEPVIAAPTKDTRQDIEQSFKTLDQLFSSTTTKPNLYFLPVSDEISEARLKELDNETSRDWAPGEVRKGRGIKFEPKFKYSFDDQDRIVEIGEDRHIDDFRGRGGFRGRGRGGRGGGWR